MSQVPNSLLLAKFIVVLYGTYMLILFYKYQNKANNRKNTFDAKYVDNSSIPSIQLKTNDISCKILNSNMKLTELFSSTCQKKQNKCIRLGTEYGGHEIPYPLCWLQPGDVYYGIGCGEDISFDLQLARLYSLDMYLFDPTPRAIQHVNNVFDVLHNRTVVNQMTFYKNKYTYNSQIFEIAGSSNAENWFENVIKLPVTTTRDSFKPWALAEYDGEMEFHAPTQGVSHSLLKMNELHAKKAKRVVTVKSLKSIMNTLQHKKVSVVKIDIEGYEISVIPYLVKFLKNLDQANWPRLLLFDMDCLRPMHKQYNYTAGMYCIDMLIELGYRVYSEHNYDYTFELVNNNNKQIIENGNHDLMLQSYTRKKTKKSNADPLANIYDSTTNTYKNGGMNADETQLFGNILSNVSSVFEWGMGSSTLLAYQKNVKRLTAVDSSSTWVNSLKANLRKSSYVLRHVDIGPTKAWGIPINDNFKIHWSKYSKAVNENSMPFDVYLVDGRFRVACACMGLWHGHKDSLVLVHDWNRKKYHIVLKVANVLTVVNNLVVLKRKDNVNMMQLETLWNEYKNVVD